jgi:hypothetical protein
MFTEEEKQLTVKEMVNHAMFLITEVSEYDDARVVLEQLQDYLNGNEEKLEEYWYDIFCLVDINSYLHFLKDENYVHLIESIFYKLIPSK